MGNRLSAARLFCLVAVLFATSGCSGGNRDVPVTDRLKVELSEAALERATWMPLAGAAMLGITGLDGKIAEWAAERNPFFGNQGRARRMSDNLQNGLIAAMGSTAVFAPYRDGYTQFPGDRLVANAMAWGGANGVVAGLKETVRRDRPDDSDHRSFPSGHAVAAFASASLFERNIGQSIDSPSLRLPVKASAFLAAAGVAWARVEGEKHHPADVLVSAAIGNLFTHTLYDSLVTGEGSAALGVSAGRDGFSVRFRHRW